MESKQSNAERSQEEMAQEYKKLKARNEWIKMNQKYLDQIQRKQLFYHKLIFIVVCVILIVSLLNLVLSWICTYSSNSTLQMLFGF